MTEKNEKSNIGNIKSYYNARKTDGSRFTVPGSAPAKYSSESKYKSISKRSATQPITVGISVR